jgi:hypothetical protein
LDCKNLGVLKMATFPTPCTIQEINPISRAKELGIFPFNGGIIDPTSGFPKKSNGTIAPAFKYLSVRGEAGDIVVQCFDGTYAVIPACAQGAMKLFVAVKVLIGSSVTIAGTSYSTSASDIAWFGGVGASS